MTEWRRRRIEQFNIFIISVRGSSPGHNIPTLMDLLEPGHLWGVRLEGIPPPYTLHPPVFVWKILGSKCDRSVWYFAESYEDISEYLIFLDQSCPQPGLPCSRPQSNLNNLIPAQAYKAGLHCTDAEYLIKLPAMVSGPHSQISWQTIFTVRWTEPWCSGASDNTITLLSTLPSLCLSMKLSTATFFSKEFTIWCFQTSSLFCLSNAIIHTLIFCHSALPS